MKQQNSFLKYTLQDLFAYFYYRRLVKIVNTLIGEHSNELELDEDLCFIFPTADPLSIKFYLNISKKIPFAKFVFRFVGGETRGVFGEKKSYKSLSENYLRYGNVRVGFEVDNYKLFLKNSGLPEQMLQWSPPPLQLSKFEIVKTKKKIIGFPGMAKERKGFHEIPKIIYEFFQQGLDVAWMIQGTIFPWANYEEIKYQILSLSKNLQIDISFFEEDIDFIQLSQNIMSCSALILPYDSSSYSMNGSAIAYRSIELGVPVIVADGVGFASEIEKYNCGRSYKNLEEIPSLFEEIISGDLGCKKFIIDSITATDNLLNF